jgi:hypothetical protein
MIITLKGADFSKNNIGNLDPSKIELFSVIPTTTRNYKNDNGITYTWNDDVCTVSGTATGQSFNNMIIMEPIVSPMTLGDIYCLKLNRTDENIYMEVYQTVNGTSTSVAIRKDGTFILNQNATRMVIRISVAAGSTVNGTISPKMYLVPITATTELFSVIPTTIRNYRENNGITYTWNGDVCTVSGTATGLSFNNMIEMEPLVSPLVPGKSYRLILNNTDKNIKLTVYQKVDEVSTPTTYSEDTTFTYNPNATRTVIRIEVASGSTVNGTITPKMYLV